MILHAKKKLYEYTSFLVRYLFKPNLYSLKKYEILKLACIQQYSFKYVYKTK